MENDYELHTDKSIELEDSINNNYKMPRNSPKNKRNLIIEKTLAHLAFIETEFTRNMEWQRHLVSQINNHPERQSQKRQADKVCHFSLNGDQQKQLKFILCYLIGELQESRGLKEMIQIAADQIRNKIRQPSIYNLSPHQKHSQEKVEFPAVPRVITLNDLAPSTQRQISATPSSLPPRTPKSKPLNQNKIQYQHKALVFTPQESESREKSEDSIQNTIRIKSQGKVSKFYDHRQPELQDSLGKRLFQDPKDRMIYIEDKSESESKGSQVSLNLSMSNQLRKGLEEEYGSLEPRKNSINFSLKSGNFQHESIYLPIPSPLQNSKQIWNPQIQNQRCADGLNFRQLPRRKIARSTLKQQNIFTYQQVFSGKVRKMHDSFGEAYQEYYLAEGLYNNKEGQICHPKNNKHKYL